MSRIVLHRLVLCCLSGAYPHFLEVDQIDFKKPVDIGDLVRLRSRGAVMVMVMVTQQ